MYDAETVKTRKSVLYRAYNNNNFNRPIISEFCMTLFSRPENDKTKHHGQHALKPKKNKKSELMLKRRATASV